MRSSLVKNRRAGLQVILLCALPLVAQTDGNKPASVEGIATNAVTGAPVPRAHVTLEGESEGQSVQYGTTSGADGKFSITDIATGSYSLAVKRVGFVRPHDRVRLTLKSGDTRTGIEVKLTPTGAITGRVTDADGEPVEGVTVFAEGGIGMTEYATTDEKGQFRIGGLAPGRYQVMASQGDIWDGPPEVRTDGTAELHTVATYYPGALTEKEAGTVVVRAASESAGADIQLVRVPFVRVSGKVVGLQRGTERVFVMVSQGVGGNGTEPKPDGSFEIWRLGPGKYKLYAEWTAPDGRKVQTAGVEIEVAASNIDNIELRVIPDSDISGRLEFEDDQVKRMIQRDLPGPLVQPFQMGAEGGSNDPASSVAADGTFDWRKVPPGKYWLGLADDKAYVKSMRLGSTVIEGAVLDLSNGSNATDLSLLLSASSGSISGTVQDDKGNAAGTVVVLVEAGPEETGFEARNATAGADGTYTIANLPPGSYKLVAVDESDPAILNNDVLGYENLMETVEVGVGEKVTKDLKRRMPR
jgi:hypothetical protein